MIIEDHALGISWFLQDLSLQFARSAQGLSVDAGINLPGGRDGVASIQARAVYNRQEKKFTTYAHVQDLDPRIFSRKISQLAFLNEQEMYLNGEATASFDEQLNVLSAAGILQADNGHLGIKDVYEQPLAYQSMVLDVAYDPAGKAIDLRRASIQAYDMELTVAGKIALAPEQVIAPLTISIPHLPQEKIKMIWPDVLRGESIEKWLLERLSAGTIDNIATALTISGVKAAEGWNVDVSDIRADFDVKGMTIDYRDPLPPAMNASGHGRLENDVLTIGIDGATISDMTVKKATVAIDNITTKAVGTAKINVALQAKLPSVLKYIETEPIGMERDKLGLDSGRVKGDADLDVEVSFPTLHDLPKDQVKVKAGGTLNDVLLPDVVKTLDLTGGPLKLTVADNKAMLSGKGKIEGRAITLDWEQFLETEGQSYSSKINAQVMADRDLRVKLGIGLDDWLEGGVPVKVAYTEYNGGRGEVAVEGDLAQATVKVNPFGYAKPPGPPGTVTCIAVLQRGEIREIKNLNVKTPELDVQKGVMNFAMENGTSVLRDGNIPLVRLNETNAALDFEISRDGKLKVGLKGAFLDARPFLKKKPKQGPYQGPAILASVDVARMRTNDLHTVDKAKIYLDLGKDGLANQLELDAVAGRGAVYMRLKPDAARKVKTFRLEADDAGAALKAFDVYKNVRGGKIRMAGESRPGKSDNVIYGTAQLSDFNVVNAPALAVLVSAISPTGLPMLLSNEGLYFSRLESKFGWGLRPLGDLYTISEGRTSGSSLGLTFEGSINKERNYIDINGHVVPMSEINSLISNIPLIGDILTGGSEGGIFAATYTMTGPIEKPVVSINPLSVLTPGIIRRILFED
jgi:hypothetical protein